MVLSEFMKSYLNGTLGLFDAVVTFSSVEHSGLGRNGDILNPWGDIIAIARAWCVTTINGSLTIGVMFDHDKDYLKYNSARWYGKIDILTYVMIGNNIIEVAGVSKYMSS